eukprot:15442659-Alexandrium_andersonii.AAC.1
MEEAEARSWELAHIATTAPSGNTLGLRAAEAQRKEARSGGRRPRRHQRRRGPPGLRPWQGVEAVEDALLRKFPDCRRLKERQAHCTARH